MYNCFLKYWLRAFSVVALMVLLSSVNGFSQKVDSLKKELKKSEGKEKVRVLNTLSDHYLLKNPSKSIDYSNKAISLAKNLQDPNLLAMSYLNIGHSLRYKSKYEKALDSLYQTIPIIEIIKPSLQTQILNLIGMLHQDLGHDTISTRGFIKKIKSNQDSDYIPRNIKILNKLSNYYKNTENYKKALSYAFRLAIFQRIANDTTALVNTMNTISSYQLKLGMHEEALRYAKIAYGLTSPNKKSDSLEANILHNLGKANWESGNGRKAIEAFQKSKNISQEIKDTSLIIENSFALGKIHAKKSNHKKALNYYNNALKLAKQQSQSNILPKILIRKGEHLAHLKRYNQAIQAIDQAKKQASEKEYEIYARIYKALSTLYENRGQHSKSLHYLKKHNTYKDSVHYASKKEAIEDVKSDYEVNKNEQRINILKKDSRIKELELSKEKARITILIIGLSALLVVIILIVFLYRNKIKTNRMLAIQNHQIKEQNEELSIINERLLETEKHLKRSNATKDTFFSIIAHDVKSPLNAFRSIIYSLKNSKTQTPETIFNYLDELDYYSSNTMELLNNLLLWARSQDEDIEPDYEDVALSEVIEKSIHNQWNNLQKKEIQIVTPETKNLLVRTDLNMMEFIARNLLNNAIKFTSKGGNVKIQITTENQDLILSVIDNGTGMDEETKQKIENKEYISKPGTEKEKGTGLGLSMCQYFLTKLNGKINIISEKGEGTRIDVVLSNAMIEKS